ncbi:MAG TPA: tetratricopeptide repeat protein [Polyangiaceae bacterium]
MATPIVAQVGAERCAAGQAAGTATVEDRKQAAKDFAEGDRAFKDGDFRHAAESYEHAYHRVPHYSALWNAARSWDHAGEPARAANLYSRYLREAPPRARDRNSAQRLLRALSNRLARLEIHATDVSDVRVDDAPVDAPSVYVTPGAHVVEGKTSDGTAVRQSSDVQAGDVVSVALVPPAAGATASTTQAAPGATATPATAGASSPASASATNDDTQHDQEQPSSSRHLSPVFVYFGGALTLALGGITIWSGLDTLQQKDTFDKNPTQSNLDSGKNKEFRTNVLIGATAAVAVVTGVTALFLIDWKGHGSKEKPDESPSVQVGAGLGSLLVRGEF